MTLPKDVVRCYGEDCNRKEDCQRRFTMRDDPVAIYSYSLSLIDDDGTCDAFIDKGGVDGI